MRAFNQVINEFINISGWDRSRRRSCLLLLGCPCMADKAAGAEVGRAAGPAVWKPGSFARTREQECPQARRELPMLPAALDESHEGNSGRSRRGRCLPLRRGPHFGPRSLSPRVTRAPVQRPALGPGRG